MILDDPQKIIFNLVKYKHIVVSVCVRGCGHVSINVSIHTLFVDPYLRAGKHAKPPCYRNHPVTFVSNKSQVTAFPKPFNRGCDEVAILIIYNI